MNAVERFYAKVDRWDPDQCWLWVGARSGRGYGNLNVGGRTCGAHRVAYELFIGSIPEGLDLDHLCRVPLCVNPKHLEPVPRRINLLRGQGFAPRNAQVTHCPRGHKYTPENTYVSKRGQRTCRECCQTYYRRNWIPSTLTNARKTHCVNGHPFDEENTRRTHYRGRPIRVCRACKREEGRRARARRRR